MLKFNEWPPTPQTVEFDPATSEAIIQEDVPYDQLGTQVGRLLCSNVEEPVTDHVLQIALNLAEHDKFVDDFEAWRDFMTGVVASIAEHRGRTTQQ